MAQIVFKLTDNKFDEFISRPLCAGDTNAYKIELSTNIDLTDCTIRIQAVRKDNVAINGLGYIVDGKATYTLPQNMYSVAGELEVRILILDAAGDTLTQKRVFFDCLDKLSDGEFYAGVDEDKTVAAQVLAHINNKSNPHDVTYNQVKDWDSIIHLGTLTGEFKVGSNGEGDYVAYEYNAGENILKFGRDTIVSFAPDEATYNNDHIMLYIYGYAYGINDPNPQYRFKNIDGTDAVELGVKTYLLLLTEDIDGNNIAQIIGDDTTNNISDTNAASLVGGSDTDLHYHSADRNRANHTGTQTASTILDFAAAVGALVTDKLTFHIVAELPDLESPLLKTDEIYFVWTQDEDYDSVDNPAYNYDMYICTPSYSTGAQPLTWTKLSGGTESSAGVLGTTLTGLSTSTSAGVYPTDTILSAIGKLQGQINGINLNVDSGGNYADFGDIEFDGEDGAASDTLMQTVTVGSLIKFKATNSPLLTDTPYLSATIDDETVYLNLNNLDAATFEADKTYIALVTAAPTKTVEGESYVLFRDYEPLTVFGNDKSAFSDIATQANKVGFGTLTTISQDIIGAINELNDKVEEGATVTRYGVKFGGSANSGATVQRLYNAFGLVAGVGTDTDTATNDFDNIYPWSGRKRCCGYWDENGSFVVNAYEGEPGYTTDGSNGEVWVETPLFYYKHTYGDDGSEEIVITSHPIGGFEPSPIHINADGSLRQKAYTAAYPMGLVDDMPTSRSGVYTPIMSLNSGMTNARKRGTNYTTTTTAEQYTKCLLMWVEFASRNIQAVMNGCSALSYSDSHTATVAEEATNRIIISNSNATAYVVGQGIGIGTALGDTSIANERTVTAITAYDDTNTAISFDGDPVNIAVGNIVFAIAWKTGSCDNVLTSSGSPVSNTSSKYTCIYRGEETPFGNAFEWISDVLFKREGSGTVEDPYSYDIYFLPDATKYNNGSITSDYVKVNYQLPTADGYVKKLGYDERFPFLRIPCEIGASNTTYYSDNYYRPAYALTAALVGGSWYNGASCGPCYWSCNLEPSSPYISRRARLSYRR